ncbi:MAG: replicative DNA helicase, partial [Oscillospiraceae bacterium]|nr:replicative DNA helicase [Oscillospiraceae bacterium]
MATTTKPALDIKAIPYSQVAEDSVLSACLQSKDAIGAAFEAGVRADDFYVPANQEIFTALVNLYNLDSPCDIAAVTNQLEKQGSLEEIGGLPRLVELIGFVQTTAGVQNNAKIVIEKSTRRKIIEVTEKIANNAYNSGDDTAQILDYAEQEIFRIAEGRNLGDFAWLPDILKDNLAKLQLKEEEEEQVKTGFSKLDDYLNGLHKGNLILIAARPAMGKTSLAMNIAHHVAHRQDKMVAIFSLEMTKEELTNRIWSGETAVEVSKIQSGDMSDRDWVQIKDGVKELRNAQLYIDDSGGTTVTEMRAKCRRLKRKGELGLVVIDHLQLMQGSRRTENRQQEVAEISRNLKLMAKDLECPVLLLSQLNRNPEGRTNNRPALSDLRESGAIEQDADVVLMLYREGYYKSDCETP